MKTNCRWLLASGKYCEKPVKYHVIDDGESPTKVRVYDLCCPEHMERAQKQMDEMLLDED